MKSPRIIIWEFLRGDMASSDFESWVYSCLEFEELVGKNLYLDLISTNFGKNESVATIKGLLNEFAREQRPFSCWCVTLPNIAAVGMTAEMPELESLEVKCRKGKEQWWLAEYLCSCCGESWLVAEETRQNDVYLLKRLSLAEKKRIEEEDCWPGDFNSLESLLRLGPEMGHRCTFADPLDSSLSCTAADLAEERPGIGLPDLQELLNLDYETAMSVAIKAIGERNVVIDLDS